MARIKFFIAASGSMEGTSVRISNDVVTMMLEEVAEDSLDDIEGITGGEIYRGKISVSAAAFPRFIERFGIKLGNQSVEDWVEENSQTTMEYETPYRMGYQYSIEKENENDKPFATKKRGVQYLHGAHIERVGKYNKVILAYDDNPEGGIEFYTKATLSLETNGRPRKTAHESLVMWAKEAAKAMSEQEQPAIADAE